jgi:hypothetical protein
MRENGVGRGVIIFLRQMRFVIVPMLLPGNEIEGGAMGETSAIGSFKKSQLRAACILTLAAFWCSGVGCARLRIVEKQTHDPVADTYTYKYKKIPEWCEYALGTFVGAVWGMATLSMFLPSKGKPESRESKEDRERWEKANAKVTDVLFEREREKKKAGSN